MIALSLLARHARRIPHPSRPTHHPVPPTHVPHVLHTAASSHIPGSIYLLTAAIALFAGLPLLVDLLAGYASLGKTRNQLVEAASKDGLTTDELKQLLAELKEPPAGVPGLARTSMALTLVVIVGITMFYLLFTHSTVVNKGILRTVLTTITGALSAIIGFYFGGKAAADSRPRQSTSDAPPVHGRHSPAGSHHHHEHGSGGHGHEQVAPPAR